MTRRSRSLALHRGRWGAAPPVAAQPPSVSVAAETEAGRAGTLDHESGDVMTLLEAGFVVDPSVDAAVDTAQPGLAGGGAVAGEGTGHAGEHVRGDGDPVVVTEEAGQHRSSGAADSAVGTGIERIGRRGQERGPARVTGGGRVAVVVCIPDGRDRSPEMEVVLGVVEG